VPEGSGLFAHSSLKTPIAAMMTHDGWPVPTAKKKIDMMFSFLSKISSQWLALPERKTTKEILYVFYILQL
jgi:hypothetical protein